ncbi:MAG: hypothetical protein HQK67_05705 [Desulfamplus sp.]|nr:hypothetical protein [Desulfamplus sp.]
MLLLIFWRRYCISGYQDEESPGRRLLELKKEDTLSLDNKTIAVQSEIFKFSFSAHADENQIISFVNSLSPDQIVLIHGDSGARDGLTNKFVCKNVHSPTIGSSIEFPEYKNRFFIIPKQTDNEELSLEQYWETCLHKGIKKISQRELEELFPNQMNEIEEFSGFRPDYLNTNFFSVITPEKRIEFIQRKKIYETIGNLEKKLVIYGEQNQFHLAFGVKQDDENMAFHLLSAKQGKPRTRIDAKKILHVFENSNGLDDISDEIQIIEKLRAMERMAAHKVKSYRQQLSFVEDGLTLEKAQHHLNIETPDIMDKIAILFALIPVAVKDDKGVWRFSSNKDSLQQMNISDTNLILDQIRNALTSYPLTKASYQNNSFVLQFDFPDAVNHSEILDKAQKSIPDPFTVSISDKINQAAFNPLLYEYLGKTGKVSLFMEEKKVVLKNIVKPLTEEFQEAFFRTTGFTVEEKLIPVPSMPNQTTTHKNQQEIISATQSCIPEHLLNSVKVGIRENVILLKADFPDVLMKTYPALLQTIESETGLKAEINSHPNSTALISLLKRKIDFRGNPSINTTEKTVKIEFISINEKIKHEIATETGFTVLKK